MRVHADPPEFPTGAKTFSEHRKTCLIPHNRAVIDLYKTFIILPLLTVSTEFSAQVARCQLRNFAIGLPEPRNQSTSVGKPVDNFPWIPTFTHFVTCRTQQFDYFVNQIEKRYTDGQIRPCVSRRLCWISRASLTAVPD